MEVSGQPHALTTLLLGEKSPHYPLNRRQGGPQIQSGCFVEEINLLLLPGYECQIIQPMALSVY